jgi:hypothetical protein
MWVSKTGEMQLNRRKDFGIQVANVSWSLQFYTEYPGFFNDGLACLAQLDDEGVAGPKDKDACNGGAGGVGLNGLASSTVTGSSGLLATILSFGVVLGVLDAARRCA